MSEEFRENAAVHGVRHNVNAVNAALDGPQSITEVVDVFVVDLFALNQGLRLLGREILLFFTSNAHTVDTDRQNEFVGVYCNGNRRSNVFRGEIEGFSCGRKTRRTHKNDISAR